MMTTGRSIHVTLDELDAWFATAQPGETLIYCSGNLATDRTHGLTLPQLAVRTYRIAQDGHAYLLQRRRGGWQFDYLMVRASTRMGRPAPMVAIGSELLA